MSYLGLNKYYPYISIHIRRESTFTTMFTITGITSIVITFIVSFKKGQWWQNKIYSWDITVSSKFILMRLLYLMNHLCHEDTLTNSFLQVALQQQNWAAFTWDFLRSIWTKRVVSFFLCLLLIFKTITVGLFNHVYIRFRTSNLGG